MGNTLKNRYEIGALFLMMIPIIIFYQFIFTHTINVPYLDDFEILNTIVRVQTEPQKWWIILTENFNGHRFGEIKLLVWLDYLIEGQINFKTLCIFGSFFLLLFWYFCLRIIQENNIPIFYFIPFTFILFQPIFHRNIFWMLSCLQYQQSIFFTIAAYYFLAKYTTKSLIIAVVLGSIHTQINGNAFYIFMLGTLIPLYQGRYKIAAIYASIGLIIGGLFYHNMPTVVGLAGYSFRDLLMSKPIIIFRALSGFLGGSLEQFTSKHRVIGASGLLLAIILGLFIASFIFFIFKHLSQKPFFKNEKREAILLKIDNLFRLRIVMILMAGSLLLTAIGVAISRGIFFKELMLVDRYLLYSVVSIGVIYLLFIMFTEGRIRLIIGIVSLPLSLIFCSHSYYKAIPQVLFYERSHQADIYDLKHHRTTNNKMFGFTPQSLALFEESLQRKIYQFPKSRFDALEKFLAKPMDSQSFKNTKLNFSFQNKVIDVYGGVKISYFYNDDFYLSEKYYGNTFFVVLKNKLTNESFLIYPHRPCLTLGDFFRNHQQFSTGFVTTVQQDCVKKGNYRIGLLVFENEKANLRYTQKYIRIENTKMIDWMQSFGYY
jgi:hypothetical protein